jgi:hypothetical protein
MNRAFLYSEMYKYMSNKNDLFLRLIQLLNSMPKDISGSVHFSSSSRCRLAAVLVIIHYKYIDNNDDDEDNNNKIPHLLLTKKFKNNRSCK